MRATLAEERALRRRADADLAKLAAAVEQLESERSAAVRKLKDVEAELAQRAADLRHARHEIRMREAELEQAVAARTTAETRAGREHSTRVAADGRRTPRARSWQRSWPTRPRVQSGSRPRLAAAARAAAPAEPPRTPASPPPTTGGAPSERREPVRLRPGTVEDGLEAAEQLLRIPDALLLVDGYNVSHAIWWEQPISVQRDRLVGALTELQARVGIDVEVVFDGADVERMPGTAPRPAVQGPVLARRCRGRRRHPRAA